MLHRFPYVVVYSYNYLLYIFFDEWLQLSYICKDLHEILEQAVIFFKCALCFGHFVSICVM